jgi:hypothetical protein
MTPPDTEDLRGKIALQWAINDYFSREGGLSYFLDACVIDCPPEPRPFGIVADPWQRELIAEKIPAVNTLAGYPGQPPSHTHFLSILARGHDKTGLEGRIASFLLAYSRRPINGYIIAADKDQGRILVEAMHQEAMLNPWFGDKLTFSKYEVSGPAGKFEVVPADAGSAYGFRGNVYILDEVTHWKEGVGEKIYGTIMSGTEKKFGSLVVAITNAWVKGSWQDELLIKPAFADPREWRVFYREGSIASWMTPERIDKVRALLPHMVAKRVLENLPIDPVEEAGYLSPVDVDACLDPLWTPHASSQPGYSYVLFGDYGPTKDRTALGVEHMEPDQRLGVDELTVWEGKNSPTGRVSIEKVEEWLLDRYKKFKPRAIVLDPYQMLGTIERLNKRGLPVVEFNARGGAGNMDLAMTLRSFIMTHRLRVTPTQGLIPGAADDTLAKEFKALVTKVKPYGWRLDHEAKMHDDRAVGIGMGATEAIKFPYVAPSKPGGEVVKTKPTGRPLQYEAQPVEIKNPLMGKESRPEPYGW